MKRKWHRLFAIDVISFCPTGSWWENVPTAARTPGVTNAIIAAAF